MTQHDGLFYSTKQYTACITSLWTALIFNHIRFYVICAIFSIYSIYIYIFNHDRLSWLEAAHQACVLPACQQMADNIIKSTQSTFCMPGDRVHQGVPPVQTGFPHIQVKPENDHSSNLQQAVSHQASQVTTDC